MSGANVGLVIVSHSRQLSEGVVELVAQMAPDVRVMPAGGLPDGGVGTDFDAVSTALVNADAGAGVVLLYDLGSAQMTAELVVESLDDPNKAVVADAPLVEGSVAAGVAAQGGRSLDAVARAAAQAGRVAAEPAEASVAEERTSVGEVEVSEVLELRNEVGLHARPAAMLARSVSGLQAQVTVSLGDMEVDAASVLGVMSLGARKGDRIKLRASGSEAKQAVQRILELAERNFDE